MSARPAGASVPPPVVDPAIDGVFHLPPSEDSRRATLAVGTILAALLLHLVLIALVLSEWRGVASPPVRPIQVTLLREPPKPPAPPPKVEPPKPKPKPAPEKPKPKPVEEKPKPPPAPPKPVEMKPRESGPDQKTEAAKRDKPKTDLPVALPVQPKAPEIPPPPEPEPLPQPPDPKPVPPRVKVKESAPGKGVMVPLDRLPAALQPQRKTEPPIRTLTLRLPSPGGGNAERDFAGDAYLNQLKNRLERNRIYPDTAVFAGALSRRAIYGVVVDPSGAIVNITLIGTTGASLLDEAAREMITNSAPFPRLPPDYPQIRTYMTILLPIYPR